VVQWRFLLVVAAGCGRIGFEQAADQCQDPATGDLVGHWKLDERSGTTAADSIGLRHGMLLNGPRWVTDGPNGSSLEFDGVDGEVLIPTFAGTLSNFSVAFWMYQHSCGTQFRSVYRRLNGHPLYPRLVLLPSATPERGCDAMFQLSIDGTTRADGGSGDNRPTIVVGRWVHVALAFDHDGGNLLTRYIDGERHSSFAFPLGQVSGGAEDLQLGLDVSFDPDAALHGRLRDFRVYSSVLDQDDVTAILANTCASMAAR
jgi:hypothetical protein